MKDREIKMFEKLGIMYPGLFLVEDVYSRWDAESEKSVVELKSREKHYDTLLIERSKYSALVEEAIRSDRRAFYVVETPKGMWAFDLIRIGDIEWEIRSMPATTEYGGGMVDKEVGFIDVREGVELCV